MSTMNFCDPRSLNPDTCANDVQGDEWQIANALIENGTRSTWPNSRLLGQVGLRRFEAVRLAKTWLTVNTPFRPYQDRT